MNSTETYKPKLFVVLSRFPYPIDKGDKLRAFYQLRDLSKEWDIYLHCITELAVLQSDKKNVEKYCKKLYVHHLSKTTSYINSALALFGSKPIQTAYFYKKSIHKKIQASLLSVEPNHVFCQLIRAAEYVKNYHNCFKTIDYMDALSEGLRRRINNSNWYRRILFKAEWKRLVRYENLIFDYFENHTIISAQDRDLIAQVNKRKIQIIPNGVGEHFFDYQTEKKPHFDLVFVGNLSYPPNIAAVNFIAKKLLPLSKKNGLHWNVLISGANPSSQLLELQSENISITGWMDDIRSSYASGVVFIAPMFIGTGLQNKILEAMAMGKPCITTSLAKNAFDKKAPLIEAENEYEFIAAIQQLCENNDYYQQISNKSSSFVRENFDWKIINQQLSDLMFKSIGENK